MKEIVGLQLALLIIHEIEDLVMIRWSLLNTNFKRFLYNRSIQEAIASLENDINKKYRNQLRDKSLCVEGGV